MHWHRWVQAYRTLALLGVLVVVALQTGASVMFAGTLEPGWHTTLLPVSYLVGAVFAGVGTLSLLTVVLRSAFHLEALVTERHLQLLACLLLGLALADIYCEATTTFVALLGSDSFDHAAELRRIAGQTAWSTWMLITAGLLPPLLFVVPRLRRSPAMLAWIGGSTAAGLWGDHYAFIVGTLQHDFLPSAAHGSHITVFEWTTFAGSFGLFLLLLLLFLRLLPVVSMAESRQLATRTGAGRQAKATPGPDHNAPIWGVAGEFATEHEMARAVNMLRERFDLRVDAYCPVPSEITAVALGLAGHSIRTFAVIGFLFGAIGTFAMCTYATLYDYVFDIGGRPDFSWQSFVVPSLSFGCLCAGMAAVGAMLVGNRLPRLNHPAFNIPGILQASTDRFFVAVHTTNGFDPKPIESAPERVAGAVCPHGATMTGGVARAVVAVVGLLALSACKREDMYTQRVIRQWDRDDTAPNQSSVRPPVLGTLAREQPNRPVPAPRIIDAALLTRGQQRYDIFCSPCHAESGDGEGMIVQRGFPHPPSFHADRLVHARAQVFYDAITYGHGVMYSYAARVPPPDRWAIAAYIRALQLSQAAPVASLSPQLQAQLAQATAPDARP